MPEQSSTSTNAVTRRQFIKTSSIAAAAVVAAPAIVSAQTAPAFRAAIIGVGGRGSGAGGDFTNAVKATGVDGKIVAVADLFPEAARKAVENFGVPEDKCLSGFDAYQKVLAMPEVNYVILATPPGFRASHFKAAVEAGKNVFMEKPVAVDGAGIRVVYGAADMATTKNLKVAAGTQRRHQATYIDTIKRLKDGAIGDLVALRAYWVNTGPIWHRGEVGSSDLERQIRNWYHYIWLCGDHICEQHVHNIDVCNWIMGTHPTKCWGMGARQQLGNKSGEIWDNFAIEYEYPNGTRLQSYCGQVQRDWGSVSEAVVGSKGTSNPAGSIHPKDGPMWRSKATGAGPYVQEHIDLINAIVKDTPLNEGRQVAESTLTAIMGREAAYSGSELDWETVLNSNFTYGPDLLYKDCAKLEFGPFRTLQPPMPHDHNIFADPPVVPIVKA